MLQREGVPLGGCAFDGFGGFDGFPQWRPKTALEKQAFQHTFGGFGGFDGFDGFGEATHLP